MQLLEPRRVKHRRKRWIKLGGAVVVAAALAAGWKSWELGRPRYLRWKQERALSQAKEFIGKRDVPNAQLALDVALKTIPGDPDALRVAAEMLEQVGAPQAMRLRRTIVDIVPESAEDTAALIVSCIRFRDFNAARDALSGASPATSRQPPMLRAALGYAIATDNGPVADALFKELELLTPGDAELRLSHAILRLKHPDAEWREKARGELEAFARSTPLAAPRIYREFAGAALYRKEFPEAQRHFARVLELPGATLNDRLQKANLDVILDRRPFAPLLAELSPHAQNEADINQLAQWLLVHGQPTEALRWLLGLPVDLQQKPLVIAAKADVYARLADWENLEQMLRAGAWGNISKQALQLAFAARIVDTPARPSLRRDAWDLALNATRSSVGGLAVLHRLASAWEWENETERALWMLARSFPDQTWAHQSLFNTYRRNKNTTGLREVMGALLASDGSVPRYQHDWALLTLLAEPTSSWTPAKETMQRLYERDSANPIYATGYAFALAQSGRAAEAAAVVEKMTAADREFPLRQPYLAYVYGVAKQASALDRAIAAGEGQNFLPEEALLFTRAREELDRRPAKPKQSATASTKS